VAAAEMAISSPLLEASIDGAHGVLLSIQGGSDLGLFEINEAAQLVANSAAVDANIIFGAVIDDALGDEVRVTVIAAGFDDQQRSRASSAATVSRTSGGVAPGGSSAAPVNTAMDVQAPASPVSPASSSSWGGTADAAPASHSAASHAASHSASNSVASHSASNSDGPSAATASNGGSAGVTGESVPGFPGWSGDAGLPRPARDAGTNGTADGAAGAGDAFASVPDQPAADAAEEPAAEGVSGYVPAPVSFVSPDDQEPGSDGVQDAGLSGFGVSSGSGSSGWKDSGRDSGAGRRRPVVFEEDDDLDVPDFLK